MNSCSGTLQFAATLTNNKARFANYLSRTV